MSEGGGGEGRWGRTERDRIREEDNVTFNRYSVIMHQKYFEIKISSLLDFIPPNTRGLVSVATRVPLPWIR